MRARRRGLRLVPKLVSGQLGTKPIAIYATSLLAATDVRQSRWTVPSPAGSARVILRGWAVPGDRGVGASQQANGLLRVPGEAHVLESRQRLPEKRSIV